MLLNILSQFRGNFVDKGSEDIDQVLLANYARFLGIDVTEGVFQLLLDLVLNLLQLELCC